LLAVNEFKKLKMITELQKRLEADAYKQKMNYAGAAGIAAEQGFLAGMDRCLHLLQQTPCTAQVCQCEEPDISVTASFDKVCTICWKPVRQLV